MKPSKTTVTPTSIATPYSRDVLETLEGIAPGYIGSAYGTREQGTAFRQLASSYQGMAEGGAPFDLSPLFRIWDRDFGTNLNRQAADAREGFGIAGSRYGSPLASGEALMRSEALRGHDMTKGQLAFGAHESAQGRRLQAGQLMGGLLGQGAEAELAYLLPLLKLVALGVNPSQTAFGPSPFSQALGGATGVAMGLGGLGWQPFGGGSAA